MIDVEDINEVPEKYRGDYVQVKEGDKTLYRNKAFIAVKEVNDKLKGRTASLEEKASAYDKLQTELEEKRKKDEEDRLKGLHDNKDYKALLEIEKQKLEDLTKRSGETVKQFEERTKALQERISTKAIEAVVSDLSTLATDAGQKLFKKAIRDRINYDAEADRFTFLDEDGGATSLDLADFKAEVLKSDTYASLIKADVSQGGKGRNAVKGGGAADLSKLPPTERITAARAQQSSKRK